MRILILVVIWLFPAALACQDSSEKQERISDYYNKGIELRSFDKDSSYYYFNKAYDYSLELNRYTDALETLISSILTATFHYDLGKYQGYLSKMENLLLRNEVLNEVEDIKYYKDRFLYEKASYLYKINDYSQAKSLFLDQYNDFFSTTKGEFADDLSIVHTINYIALIYTHTEKYDLAENYFKRSLALIKANPTNESRGYELATLHLLAQLYVLTGRYSDADTILKNVLEAYKNRYEVDEEYKNNLVAAYQKLVQNAIDQDSLLTARQYLNESQKYYLKDDPFHKQSLLLYGEIFSKLKNEALALKNYNEALQYFQEYRHFKPHEDVAEVYAKIAELYLKNDKPKNGIEAINNAFNNAGRDIDITNFNENPGPHQVFSKKQLLHLLDVKLQLLLALYETTDEEEYLEGAIKLNDDILQTFDVLKKEFESKLDKQFLAEKAYPMFERMLDVVYRAYQKNSTGELLELALNIGEKSKDFMLMEALRNAQATKYGNVPKAVLDREAQLRAKITYLEKEIFDAKEAENGFSNDLFRMKQRYYGLLDTIRTNYPKYYTLKYQNTPIKLADVRKGILNENTVLISYSMTDNSLYAIVLSSDDQKFLKLPFSNSDRRAVRDFYQLISRPAIDGAQVQISELGELLFEKTLKGPLETFAAENLTIIPDGELHYIPFDLLRQKGSYLLETKNIGYGNSVASLIELTEKKNKEKGTVLAFAPSFDDVVETNTSRQFGRLSYNDEEVSKIAEFYETETVLNEKATLANFRAKTSNYNIVHLATHASANDAYPDYSYLAFSQETDSVQTNILYVRDLYDISLNADMVTLSACQTGIGKLQRGQGMLSLSKGFYYAGAKSLVNTLWKINDKSSVKLMEYFYEGLSKGKSKTWALRDAKLKYLETTDDDLLKHPYYWSAFVVSGNLSPISKTNYWWYVGAAVLFFILLFFFSKLKKRLTFKGALH